MQVVYARQPFPTKTTKSIFLAGPTPRSSLVHSWRPQAVEMLQAMGYDGDVYVPEDATGSPQFDYMNQVDWEDEGLRRADCIVFWIPRSMATMPALTTNDEWGFWKNSGKVVLGTPEGAERVRYQRHYADKLKIPLSDTLVATLMSAMTMVGNGAPRSEGECYVPVNIWRTAAFQGWYANLKAAGNRLDEARVEWSFRVGPKQFPIFFTMWASVHIGAENRNKINEIVLFRPDVSNVVLYRKRGTLGETQVVLVKEFRTPVSNGEGYVYELPGGSSKVAVDPRVVAVEEVHEEIGLAIAPERLRVIEARQLAATLSAHRGTVYAAELTESELARLQADQGNVHGVEADSERTYVEVRSIAEIAGQDLVDWSALGMILRAIAV